MMTSQNWLRLTVMVVLLMSFICIFVVLDGEKSSVSNVRGTFTVRGTKIYDPKGNEFIIKGVNIDGPHWVWSFDMTRYADMIATVWKFNLVRVNTMLKGENWQDDVDVERIVNAFTSRGVVVMFEVHNWTGN